MKNFSIALNAILLVLVIILFVMVNNLKKGMDGGSASVGKNKLLRIAYVNADSINADYMLMKDFNSEIQAKESQFQDEYNAKAKRLQDEYQAYMQKKQAGNTSELDDEKAQKSLGEKKNELDAMQQEREELLKDVQERNFELQKKIQKFIVDYNKTARFDYVLGYENIGGSLLYGNDSLDITKPIIAGLNQQYKDSVQKASSGAKH